MASISVDIGSIPQLGNFIFHALNLEWVFYSGGFKTSPDAGLTWSLKKQVPLSSWSRVAMAYDRVGNRLHIAETHGSASSRPLYFVSGTPREDGQIDWGTVQELWPYTGDLYQDHSVYQVQCDSNGYPWISFVTSTAFGNTFRRISKSSTKEQFTNQWEVMSSFNYPGSQSSPYFSMGLLIPSGNGMYFAYTQTRTTSGGGNVDADSPVLFSRTISAEGVFSDPPTRIRGTIPTQPATGLKVGSDHHIALRDTNVNTILHFSNGIEKTVQSGVNAIPVLTHDIKRNRLLCFWNNSNHLYYKAYDLTSGTWDTDPTDWLNEAAFGGITSLYMQMNPLNDFDYERSPISYQSQSYVRFALSNLQPPKVRTLPATNISIISRR